MRQIAKMETRESYLDGFQLGKRISENPQNSSFPRYKNAVTSFKSKSCGINHKKSAPDPMKEIVILNDSILATNCFCPPYQLFLSTLPQILEVTVKGRPGGRPTQDILQVSLKNNYEMRIDDNFPPMSFRA